MPRLLGARAIRYKLWTVFPGDIHLFGPVNPRDTMFLLGGDRLGRDMLSRIIYGARASLSIGLVGVTFSLVLGILFGGIPAIIGGRRGLARAARHRVHPLAADDPDLARAGGGAAEELVAAHHLFHASR